MSGWKSDKISTIKNVDLMEFPAPGFASKSVLELQVFQKKLNKIIKQRHQTIICLKHMKLESGGWWSSRCVIFFFLRLKVVKGGKIPSGERQVPDPSCEVINAVICNRCRILETEPWKQNSRPMTSLLLIHKRPETKISLLLAL